MSAATGCCGLSGKVGRTSAGDGCENALGFGAGWVGDGATSPLAGGTCNFWRSAEPGAGFTTGTPWLPIPDDLSAANVEAQRNHPSSLLWLYRRVIDLRRGEPALHGGSYRAVDAGGAVLAYVREWTDGSRFLVALNLGPEPARLDGLRSADVEGGTVVVGTHGGRDGELVGDTLYLRGDEGVVVRLPAWNMPDGGAESSVRS